MTKAKIEKEAENWLRKYLLCCNCEKKCNCIDSNSYCEEQVLKAYVDSAEPREKQIQIDAEQIRALQKQNGELTDKVRELVDRLCNVANNLLDSWCRNEEDYCPHLAKLEKENLKVKQGCHKWFKRWREVKQKELEAFSRIAELEAQIEKMKCCANCKHSRTEYEHCRTDKHEKWEIKND